MTLSAVCNIDGSFDLALVVFGAFFPPEALPPTREDTVRGPSPLLTAVPPGPACTRATRGPTLALSPEPEALSLTPGANRNPILTMKT